MLSYAGFVETQLSRRDPLALGFPFLNPFSQALLIGLARDLHFVFVETVAPCKFVAGLQGVMEFNFCPGFGPIAFLRNLLSHPDALDQPCGFLGHVLRVLRKRESIFVPRAPKL